MEKSFNGVVVEIRKGDIANQEDADAIVNAANADLVIGGGVAGAIHRKGDPELKELTRPLAPISPGGAVITAAPNLPNSHVIHCLGPVYGKDTPSDELLASCYREALKLAEEHGVEVIAFPALSTGAFGYPMREAAGIAFNTIKDQSDSLETIKRVHFVLFDQQSFDIHKEVLSDV
jgi:O-acetyl-ADP-ribose deacetylase (regulator of RNase III)